MKLIVRLVEHRSRTRPGTLANANIDLAIRAPKNVEIEVNDAPQFGLVEFIAGVSDPVQRLSRHKRYNSVLNPLISSSRRSSHLETRRPNAPHLGDGMDSLAR